MIKKINLLIVLILSISVYGQDKNDLYEMINSSILKVVNIHQEYVKKGIIRQEVLDKYYILKDNLPQNYIFSDSIINLNLRKAYIAEIPTKELKKGVFGISSGSVILNKDKIIIYIGIKGVTVKKNNLHISRGDSYSFTYQYSCDEKEWKLVDSVPKL